MLGQHKGLNFNKKYTSLESDDMIAINPKAVWDIRRF